jgi:hypothetical protein
MAIDINIGSKLDAKGFKQAETATEKLTKNVKNLAGNLGLAFGTAAVVAYGKASVRAALESQAEQERLNNILRVTTGATQAQIDVLNEQADALERIGVVTGGNIKMTQSQLATFDLQISTIKTLTPAILDYVTAEKGATASASDFKSMTNGLAQALNGNFASLTRTGFVLDEVTKKTIKEGTETERAAALVKVLNSTYKDFNANLRNTDSGKMQVLANTAREVQTIIGAGIIDSLKLLSEDTTIDGLTAKMKELAVATSDVSTGFSLFLKDVKDGLEADPILGSFFGWLLDDIGSGIIFEKAGKERRERLAYNKNEHKAKQVSLSLDNKADKLSKSQLSAQKKLLATQQKIAAEKKKQEILDKASLLLAQGQKIFDEEGIQLAAAAQGKLTEEERVRLALKKDIFDLEAAINEGNVGAAAKLADSLLGNAQKLAALRTEMMGLNNIENPFTAWLQTLTQMSSELDKMVKSVENQLRTTIRTMLDSISGALAKLQALNGRNTPIEEQRSIIGEKLAAARPDITALQDQLARMGVPGYSQSSANSTSVVVNVAGSVSTERDLVSAITQGLYAQQASGTPVNYSTVY